MGVHYRSAQRWVEWYRDGGLNEVVSRKMGGVGQPRFLSESQERRLVVEVGSGRFRTAGEIADWVESEYGVRFRGNSIYSVLERLGCSPKVPRPRHDKANLDAQRRWKKGGLGRSLRRAGVSSGTLIGFADEMRVGLRGMVRRVWGVRGVKVVQRLQLVYEWKYLFLVWTLRVGSWSGRG